MARDLLVCFWGYFRRVAGEVARQKMTNTVEKLKRGVAIKSRRSPVEHGSWHSNALL
jgi:hypothetical protein